MPENVVLAPAPEIIPTKGLPEPPYEELPNSFTLPEPPVEVEASGLGRDNLDSLNEPSIEEDQTSLVENEDVKSEDEPEKVDPASFGEESVTTTFEDEQQDEISKEPEVSTILEKLVIEQEQPALLPPTETVNILSKESDPDVVKTTFHSDFDEPVVKAPKDSNKNDPDEDIGASVVFTYPEEPVFDEKGFDKTPESDGREVNEGYLSEAKGKDEEGPLTPEILAGDLVEDEILLVNKEDPKVAGKDFPHHPLPTVLSPEKESPFTIISSVIPNLDALPDIAITSLVKVKLILTS